jgi:hypothetical protein
MANPMRNSSRRVPANVVALGFDAVHSVITPCTTAFDGDGRSGLRFFSASFASVWAV